MIDTLILILNKNLNDNRMLWNAVSLAVGDFMIVMLRIKYMDISYCNRENSSLVEGSSISSNLSFSKIKYFTYLSLLMAGKGSPLSL
jgi:hypothetical protein